jgi:hypothetical protein
MEDLLYVCFAQFDEQKALSLQACEEFFSVWIMIVPCLTQLEQMMRHALSSMIPKQKDKAWNGASKEQKISISKVKKTVILVMFFSSQGIIHKEFVQ